MPLPGFGWVNLARSKALAFDVYHAASAARLRPRGWVDRPSEGILVTYGLIYQVLAQALQPKDSATARRAIAIADSITKNSSDFRTALRRQELRNEIGYRIRDAVVARDLGRHRRRGAACRPASSAPTPPRAPGRRSRAASTCCTRRSACASTRRTASCSAR